MNSREYSMATLAWHHDTNLQNIRYYKPRTEAEQGEPRADAE